MISISIQFNLERWRLVLYLNHISFLGLLFWALLRQVWLFHILLLLQRFHGILSLVLSNAVYEECHLFFVYLSVIVYINLGEQSV
jgi:hypothetical protein